MNIFKKNMRIIWAHLSRIAPKEYLEGLITKYGNDIWRKMKKPKKK